MSHLYRLALPFLLFFALLGNRAQGQDVQFSQFYATSEFMNPAFVGKGHLSRAYLHRRWQWPSATVRYNSTLVAADGFVEKYRSGIGAYFLHDEVNTDIGFAQTSYEVAGLYSYEMPIRRNLRRFSTLRVGGQVGARVKTIGGGLSMPSTFTDDQGNLGGQNSYDLLAQQAMLIQPDVAVGALFYTKNYWIGFAGHHLNYPRNNFFTENNEVLHGRYAVIGGYKFNLDNRKHDNVLVRDKDYHWIPTFHYKSQNKNDQLDIGSYFVLDWAILGAWYRGIPIKTYNGGSGPLSGVVPERNHNNESVILMVGGNIFPYVQLRYSYDIVVSTLAQMGPGGAHELHLELVNDRTGKKARPQRSMPCPDFHHRDGSWFNKKKMRTPKYKKSNDF